MDSKSLHHLPKGPRVHRTTHPNCQQSSQQMQRDWRWSKPRTPFTTCHATHSQFLVEGSQWEIESKTSPLRGLVDNTDDDDDLTPPWSCWQYRWWWWPHPSVVLLTIPMMMMMTSPSHRQTLRNRRSMMLGHVANYCPVISRNTKNSMSTASIWQVICNTLWYSVNRRTLHWLCWYPPLPGWATREDLYQRLMAFVEDNLLH